MTTEEFWKSWLAFGIVAGPIVLGVVNMAYSQYLRYRHLNAMIEALKNSRYIYIRGPGLRKQGFIEASLMIAKIGQMIFMPRSSLKIGELDPGDLENFPTHLRRLLKIKSVMLTIIGIWAVIAFVLVKLR